MPHLEVVSEPTFVDEAIRPLFSMEPVGGLSPAHPYEMAQRLVGTYVLNARAIQTTSELSAKYFLPASIGHRQILEVAKKAARENLAVVAEELGARTLIITELLPGRIEIENQDDKHVTQAIGTPNIHTTNHLVRLAPASNIHLLRTFDYPPRGPSRHRPELKWCDARIVSPQGTPLVHIDVLPPGCRI